MDDTESTGRSGGGDAIKQAKAWLARHGAESSANNDQHRDNPQLPVDDLTADRRVGPMGADEDVTGVARAIVLRKLAGQARTRQELSKALRAKAVPDEVGRHVLDRMEEVGLVNDADFARGWVESRQARRHLSRSALRRELSGKGVAVDQVEAALETVDVDDEHAAARALAEKKLR